MFRIKCHVDETDTIAPVTLSIFKEVEGELLYIAHSCGISKEDAYNSLYKELYEKVDELMQTNLNLRQSLKDCSDKIEKLICAAAFVKSAQGYWIP